MNTPNIHPATEETVSFKEAYGTLKQPADTMRSQHEPDIDALVPMVHKAVAAYTVRTKRMEAVREMLNQKLCMEGQ